MHATSPYLITFAAPLITILYASVSSAVVIPMRPNHKPGPSCNPADDGALHVPQTDVARLITKVCDSIPETTMNKNRLRVYYPSSNNLIIDFCINIPALTSGWPDSASCKGHFDELIHGCKHAATGAMVNYGGGIPEGDNVLDTTWYNVTITDREVVETGPSPLEMPRTPITQFQTTEGEKNEPGKDSEKKEQKKTTLPEA